MSETPASPTLAPEEPTPVVGLTFDSFADCFEGAPTWLSKSQVFISTDTALPIGSPVSVEVSVIDGTPLIRAFGRVSWVRKQRIREDQPAGISVGIIHLDTASAALIDAVERCRQNAAAAPRLDAAPSGTHEVDTLDADDGGDGGNGHDATALADLDQTLDAEALPDLDVDPDAGIDGDSTFDEGAFVDEAIADGEIDVDADVASAVERMEAVPQTTGTDTAAAPSDAAAGSMVVTASAMFADGLHFGEDGAPGTHPEIPTGHELDELTEISFSDVENAVSREIDASVLRRRIQDRAADGAGELPTQEIETEAAGSADQPISEVAEPEVAEPEVEVDPSPSLAAEVVLDDDALHREAMIGAGDDHYGEDLYHAQFEESFDPDDDGLDDDFDEESEILAPLELALVEVDRTPSAALDAEASPAADAPDDGHLATPEHDTQAVDTLPSEAISEDASSSSGSISTAAISTEDLHRAAEARDVIAASLETAEVAEAGDEAEDGEQATGAKSKSLSTAIISTAALAAAAASQEWATEEEAPSAEVQAAEEPAIEAAATEAAATDERVTDDLAIEAADRAHLESERAETEDADLEEAASEAADLEPLVASDSVPVYEADAGIPIESVPDIEAEAQNEAEAQSEAATHDTAPVHAIDSDADDAESDADISTAAIALTADTEHDEVDAATEAETVLEEPAHFDASRADASPSEDVNDETLDEAGEREAHFREARPISDSVEISAREMAARLLEASRDETNDTQPTMIPDEPTGEGDYASEGAMAEGTAAEDIATQEVSFEAVHEADELAAASLDAIDSAQADATEVASSETAPAEPDRVPQPGYDPWDLDVSSFIDDALQERAPADRAGSTEVMPPPDMLDDAPAESPAASMERQPATGAPEPEAPSEDEAVVLAAEVDEEPRPYSSDDSTITVLPSATREEDDTLSFGPPRTPVAPPDPFAGKPEPERPIAVPPPASEHPEAFGELPEGVAEDKTLSFQKLEQIAAPPADEVFVEGDLPAGDSAPLSTDEMSTEVIAPAALRALKPNDAARTGETPGAPVDAPFIAAMDDEPDFGTMAARIEIPPQGPAEATMTAETADTAQITLPAEELRAAVAAAAEAHEPTPSAFEETVKLPTVTVPPTVLAPEEPPTPSAPSGYYATAGAKRRRRRASGLGLLAAVFCLAVLALALFRTGAAGKLSTWARDTFQSSPGDQVADVDTSPRAPRPGNPSTTPRPESTTARPPAAGSDAAVPETSTGTERVDGGSVDSATEGTRTAADSSSLASPSPGTETPAQAPTSAGSEADVPSATTADRPSDPAIAARGTSPAEASPPPAAQDPQTARQALRAAVEGWAAAWSSQDPDAYLAFYDASYETPDGLSRTAWEDQRRVRLRAPRSLEVRTSEHEVESLEGDQATLKFFQSYRANTAGGMRNLGTWKRFDMVRRAGEWRIVRERLVR